MTSPASTQTSAFVQIQDAIVSQIAAVVDGLCVGVYANRLRPIAASKNAVVVRIEQSSAQDVVCHAKDWRTLYIVECYAHAAPRTDPLREADVLVSRIAPMLAALDLSSLGVIEVFGSGGIKWQFDEANDAMVCAMLGFEVMHRTAINSITPWGSP